MKAIFSISERTHGSGPVFFTWQRSRGNYIVTTGYDQKLNIYDRTGTLRDQLALPAMCSCMAWDKEGDILSVVTERSPAVFLWDATTERVSQVDSGMRDVLTLLLWAENGAVLAVGTSKGHLLIYHHRTARKVPILGKHSKRITYGAWSKENMLALVAEDNVLSVSNQEGDTLCHNTLKAEASLVAFTALGGNQTETTVSIVLARRSLFLFDIYDPENPLILAFQERYGNILEYKWHSDGQVIVAFDGGYITSMSTTASHIGEEMFRVRTSPLTHVAMCVAHGRVATVSSDITLRIYDLADELQEVQAVAVLDDLRRVEWMSWSDDGQLLGVSGATGALQVFLARLPMLGSAHLSRYAVLSSLSEITVQSVTEPNYNVTIRTPVEPSFLALGPFHIAIGMNNQAWFYTIDVTDNGVEPNSKAFLGTIKSISLNADYTAALLADGRVHLQVIESTSHSGVEEERESKLFPEKRSAAITAMDMTDDFLVFANEKGDLEWFLFEDWNTVNRYRHTRGILQIFLHPLGSVLVFVDDERRTYLYSAVDDTILQLDDSSKKIDNLLWDVQATIGSTCFVIFDETQLHVYLWVHDSVTTNANITKVLPSTPIQGNQKPILLSGGEVVCQTSTGKTTILPLNTHQVDKSLNGKAQMKDMLSKCMALHRWQESWQQCEELNTPEDWRKLAETALKFLNLRFAMRAYRRIPDVGMVWSLESIAHIEDKSMLAGYVAMFNSDFDLAQEHFVVSAKPTIALDMRRDLLQWEQALQLAKRLDPEAVAELSREYALQLEFNGDYQNAAQHFEAALQEKDDRLCRAGIARTSLHCGDIRKGVQMALEIDDRTLLRECAEILENMKQLLEAAVLFEKARYYDRAASLYIRLRNWPQVSQIIDNVTSSKVHLEYAKAREADGHYNEALNSYAAAGDTDSVIRLQLKHLNNPEEAVRLAKETRSIGGAKLVADFFLQRNDPVSAIHFLVLSKCAHQAMELAKQQKRMDAYGQAIGDDGTEEDYLEIAQHHEREKDTLNAGRFYAKAGQYTKALKLLLKAAATGDSAEALQASEWCVTKSNDARLADQLIRYLLGETDGIPKDYRHLFKLYMSLERFEDAAKTAVIIAREEQKAGNYKNAHDALLMMHRALQQHNIPITREMYQSLVMIHSYVLVKLQAKRGNHEGAARLLLRLVDAIGSFPAHDVQILTSAAVECQRANMGESAFQCASILMRPEYRSRIDAKYKKTIEHLIRKSQRNNNPEEPLSPCPMCLTPIYDYNLTCASCKNALPMCIVSGKHIVADQVCICPSCSFPMIASELKLIIQGEQATTKCPMCNETIEELLPLQNVQQYLNTMKTN